MRQYLPLRLVVFASAETSWQSPKQHCLSYCLGFRLLHREPFDPVEEVDFHVAVAAVNDGACHAADEDVDWYRYLGDKGGDAVDDDVWLRDVDDDNDEVLALNDAVAE